MLSAIFTQLTYIVKKQKKMISRNWYHFLSSSRRDLKLYREDKLILHDSWAESRELL